MLRLIILVTICPEGEFKLD